MKTQMLFLLFSLLLATTLSGQPKGSVKIMDRQQAMIDTLLHESTMYITKNNELVKKNEALKDLIDSLYLRYLKKPWSGVLGGGGDDIRGSRNYPPITNNGGDSGGSNGGTNFNENYYKEELAKLRRSLDRQTRRYNQLNNSLNRERIEWQTEKAGFLSVIESLKRESLQLEEDLRLRGEELRLTMAELQRSNELLECTREFYRRSLRLRNAAADSLERARKLYERFEAIKDRNGAAFDNEVKEILDYIFDTYEKYDDSPQETNCGDGIIARDVISYMNARDHLNMAIILANDPRHLINRFPGEPDPRLIRINAAMIGHISQVFNKKGGFDDQKLAQKMSRDFEGLMKVAPGVMATGAGVNPINPYGRKSLENYDKVGRLYEEGKFVEALGIYNDAQRIEQEGHLQTMKDTLALTKSAMGVSILFNLGGLRENKSFLLSDSWLDRKLKDQRGTGESLLHDVLDLETNEGEKFPEDSEIGKLQRDAAYMLGKYYFPTNRDTRSLKKQNKKIAQGKAVPTQPKDDLAGAKLGVTPFPSQARWTVLPSVYPYYPVQQGFFRDDGSVGITLNGSGIEGGLRLQKYSPGPGVSYGVDVGFSRQFYEMEDNSIRLPPSTLTTNTIFGGPFIAVAGGKIQKEFHPRLTVGLSYRNDFYRALRVSTIANNGERLSQLITNLPFLERSSWYGKIGVGFNRERFIFTKQRVIPSAFELYAFVPLFNKAIQVSGDPASFTQPYSQSFLDLRRQTIHFGLTFSKFIELRGNGITRVKSETYPMRKEQLRPRMLPPLVDNDPPSRKLSGRFSLLFNNQPLKDSLFIPSDSSYTNLRPSVGWRVAYSVHFGGNNQKAYTQEGGIIDDKVYNFFLTAGVHQQVYRLHEKERYRSFRAFNGQAEVGARFGGGGLMVFGGVGGNFSLGNSAIYAPGEGVLKNFHQLYFFGGLLIDNMVTLRVSTNLLDVESTGKSIGFEGVNFQFGFGL